MSDKKKEIYDYYFFHLREFTHEPTMSYRNSGKEQGIIKMRAASGR